MDAEQVRNWVLENSFTCHEFAANPKLIVLGEKHLPEYYPAQERLIERVPFHVLFHEALQFFCYYPQSEELQFTPARRIGRAEVTFETIHRTSFVPNHLRDWAHKYNFPIIGIDSSITELEDIARNTSDQRAQERKQLLLRDATMGDSIGRYFKNDSLAIVGTYHQRPRSVLHQKLAQSGIPYWSIDMTRQYWIRR